MQFYFHVITNRVFLRDSEGSEFSDLLEVEGDAIETIRELVADEVRRGKPIPLGWKLLIASPKDTVIKCLPFTKLQET
jgi:hypothetical protein